MRLQGPGGGELAPAGRSEDTILAVKGARKPLVAGNWKMNLSLQEAEDLTRNVAARSRDFPEKIDIVLLPPFPFLSRVAELLRDTKLGLGAQDVYWEAKGAFTGEVSAPMLSSVGCRYCLVGHSERRHIFGETLEATNRKLRALLASGITPILCVGEKLEERKNGSTEEVLERQLLAALNGLGAVPAGLVLAYEPVWAIGTGVNATPEQAQDVHSFLRDRIRRIAGNAAGDSVRIVYGGSVNPENASSLMSQPDVDGALVGGASLKASSFEQIIRQVIQE